MLVFAVLARAPMALAAEVDARVLLDDAPVADLTFHAVADGPLGAVDVPRPGRPSLRFAFTTARPNATQVTFEVRISEVTVDRRGREKATLVSTPRITAMVGEDATVLQGERVPVDGAYVERTTEITLVYRE
jgi:hypothetical protein